ncbi:MAG: hypothetical protein JWQ25_539 [Daejeonella sp.]|nr:hypothetical protein [Daejeonella sp.]
MSNQSSSVFSVKHFNQKVSGSTLVEVLVSMVIMMIVFSIAIGIYAKVTTSTVSITKQKIQLQSATIIQQSINEHNWSDQTFLMDSLQFEKKVIPYSGYEDVVEIQVEALNQGISQGIIKQLVKQENASLTSIQE